MFRLRTALLLTLALAAVPALAQQNLNTISDDLVARAGERYGNLDTISGDIDIQAGASVRTVNTVSGDITLAQGATAGGRLETVSGDIEAAGKVTTGAGIGTVSGDIEFERGGRVGGDIETVSGDIELTATQVVGGLETVVGDITVGVDSRVSGGIHVERNKSEQRNGNRRDPRIVIGPNAVVEGTLVFERPVELYVHRTAKTGPVSGATAKVFDTPTPPRQD